MNNDNRNIGLSVMIVLIIFGVIPMFIMAWPFFNHVFNLFVN